MKDKLLAFGFMYVWATSLMKAIDFSKDSQILVLLLGGITSLTMIALVLEIENKNQEIRSMKSKEKSLLERLQLNKLKP